MPRLARFSDSATTNGVDRRGVLTIEAALQRRGWDRRINRFMGAAASGAPRIRGFIPPLAR